jgi:hypothetical protein
MRIDARAVSLAAGFTAAILFVLCAAWVALAPDAATGAFSFLLHLDLSGMARTLSWASFLGGLVAWSAGMGLTFGLAAWLYNRFMSFPGAA